MRDIRRGELCKEDILTALDELTIDHHRAANTRLPKRQVEDVMKAKRNQGALDDAEDKCADVARARNEASERKDAILHRRPDKVHDNAHKEIDNRRDDRHKARTAEEGKRIGKDNIMKAIVQICNTDADNDTAEDAHLQGFNAAGRCNRTFEHEIRRLAIDDHAVNLQHGIDCSVHDEERDHRRECSNFFFCLCHANGDTDRKDNRQITEDRVARTRHDSQQRIEHRTLTDDCTKSIRFNRRYIRKRRADTEQDASDRQDGNRQHETSPDALKNAENLIFHVSFTLSKNIQNTYPHTTGNT